MSSIKVNCGNIEISNDNKICIIAGPCQLETEQHAMDMAGKINEITKKFKSLNFDPSKNLVFSCGSGVTASVLALAYSLINDKYMPTIYDGSWSEYGKS